ncbi:DUF3575 domain-containing protein [Pontibacter sp. HSC-14F20]|uniref:DUF3575 domain-containing protein n=1 Tax=Pontibacter sp. HSC-14F20 TaxID=2864136 RepID=UPI001C73AB37|nr:DUF3575 domain-containing protein [Pontibacter sp. HSC-14F20]MBX0333731.1 DUF3575 domain-containing protein [Pontibacter sp. HSC-14F20]
MKNSIILAFAAAALFFIPTQQAHAQAQQPKRAVIKVNPLSAFALTGSGFLEYAITDNLSAQLGASLTGVSISNVKFRGYGFTPEVRYYFSENKVAPMGPYVAGYGRIRSFKLTAEKKDEEGRDYSATYKPVGAGVAIGNQWIFNSGLTLDVFMGAGYNGGNLKVNAGTEEDFDTGIIGDMLLGGGFSFRPGIAIGYNF